MILVSKIVANGIARRAEQLAESPVLQAVRRMPGFASYDRAMRAMSQDERRVQKEEAATEIEMSKPRSSTW